MLRCALVAIARNEGRYLPEWIAYHLSIGVDQIVIYNNSSSDNTREVLACIGSNFPVQTIDWPGLAGQSPQRTAYKDSLPRLHDMDFVGFIDIDEFVVPWGYHDIKGFLSAAPPTASAVVINWRSFGSSGLTDSNYTSVIETFTQCAKPGAGNNKHVKTFARPRDIQEPFIHHVTLNRGDVVDSNFQPVVFESQGKLATPVYEGIQINHYQVKTFDEFALRMARGNANFPEGHPGHARDASHERFKYLDRNEMFDKSIEKFLPAFRVWLSRINAALEKETDVDQ